jgi:hypothetical protein
MSDKGELVIRPGIGPRITVKEGSSFTSYRVKPADLTIDDCLVGVSEYDLGGRSTGYSRFVQKTGGAGSGDEVGEYPQRHSNYDVGGYETIDQGDYINEHPGEIDMLGNPNNGPARKEYLDPADSKPDEFRRDQSGWRDQEDIWSRDLFDTFDENGGEPQERPKRKPALFDDGGTKFTIGSTFSKRGLDL